jgi:hypothetical protein
MRTNVQQQQHGNGPFGVRPGVWLFVAIVVLALVALNLFRRAADRPDTVKLISRETSGPALRATAGRIVASRLSAQMVETLPGAAAPLPGQTLNPDEAKVLACRIANQRATELYGWSPFTEFPAAAFDQGCWSWRELRGCGLYDFDAMVQFCEDGSIPSVDINLLIFDGSRER